MPARPVLYLDLDDTLIIWERDRPRGAPGAGEFVRWSLEHFEVRWLTRWAPGGEMPAHLLADLTRMLGLPPELLASIRGLDWSETRSKLDGIAWLEHLVLGRPFVWIEDDGIGPAATAFLQHNGLRHAHCLCNVSSDPGAIARAHAVLARWLAHDPALQGCREI